MTKKAEHKAYREPDVKEKKSAEIAKDTYLFSVSSAVPHCSIHTKTAQDENAEAAEIDELNNIPRTIISYQTCWTIVLCNQDLHSWSSPL